jgi:hypothetical protein
MEAVSSIRNQRTSHAVVTRDPPSREALSIISPVGTTYLYKTGFSRKNKNSFYDETVNRSFSK